MWYQFKKKHPGGGATHYQGYRACRDTLFHRVCFKSWLQLLIKIHANVRPGRQLTMDQCRASHHPHASPGFSLARVYCCRHWACDPAYSRPTDLSLLFRQNLKRERRAGCGEGGREKKELWTETFLIYKPPPKKISSIELYWVWLNSIIAIKSHFSKFLSQEWVIRD